MRIQVKLIYELDADEWYEDEKLSKKEKLAKLQEDLSDISVHCQHCNYDTLMGCEVTEIK